MLCEMIGAGDWGGFLHKCITLSKKFKVMHLCENRPLILCSLKICSVHENTEYTITINSLTFEGEKAMSELMQAIVHMMGMLALLVLATFFIDKKIVSHFNKTGAKLTQENKKEIKWLVSSILLILTIYFSLLRLLLLL